MLWSFPKIRRPRGSTLFLLVYTLTLFLFFFFLTFPYKWLLKFLEGKLSQRTPLSWTYTLEGFSWRQGYQLSHVALHFPLPNRPSFSLTSLSLRPRLEGLIVGKPFPLSIWGKLYGGKLEGRLSWQEPQLQGLLDLKGIDLSLLPFPKDLNLKGTLNARISWAGPPNNLYHQKGVIEALLDKGQVKGHIPGLSLPDLSFSRLLLRGKLQEGRMEVQELQAHLEGLELRGEGQIALQKPLFQSRLHLRLSFKTTPSLSPKGRLLLALLPFSSGSQEHRSLVLSGTAKHPRLRW